MSYFDLPSLIKKMLACNENINGLHFTVGRPAQILVSGRLLTAGVKGLRALTAFQTEIISMCLLEDNNMAEKLIKIGAVETSFSLDEFTRFRVLIYSQDYKYSIAMQLIP